LVLKPDAGACHDWLGEVLTGMEPQDVRVARPVPTLRGSWRHEGWAATEWVQGVEPRPRTRTVWLDVIGAGRALHRALAPLPRPDCLDARQDPWAAADRAAWGERHLALHPLFAPVARRLQEALERPGRSQLVHGDLTGNVLFATGLPPAVIDLSPYWRPPEYAEGVVLADALSWHDASPSLVQDAGVPVAAVARGLLFRMLATSERVSRGERVTVDVADEAHRYGRAATALGL
jgi:hypothetical protein